jgi:glycosyltransferase involved in cell wall biosynthesis
VISIIIPFLNAEAWLADAVESALGQTGVDFEIVCVDDGSTDGSLGVARRFEPAVRVIAGPGGGVSAARNRGIAETLGEWLVFLDSDDLLLSGTLRQRLDITASTGADVIICDWQELIDDESTRTEGAIRAFETPFPGKSIELSCATRLWAPLAALMYRRSLVAKIGGFKRDLPVIQDARFLFDAAQRGARFVRSPHVGARYRLRPQSLSRRDPARFWRDVLLNGTQIEALWRARGCLAADQRAALADIYNGAAHGLFRACDPGFRDALASLRESGLPIGWRNRVAELVTDVSGQRAAVRLAELWTIVRWAWQGAGQTGAKLRMGRAG